MNWLKGILLIGNFAKFSTPAWNMLAASKIQILQRIRAACRGKSQGAWRTVVLGHACWGFVRISAKPLIWKQANWMSENNWIAVALTCGKLEGHSNLYPIYKTRRVTYNEDILGNWSLVSVTVLRRLTLHQPCLVLFSGSRSQVM